MRGRPGLRAAVVALLAQGAVPRRGGGRRGDDRAAQARELSRRTHSSRNACSSWIVWLAPGSRTTSTAGCDRGQALLVGGRERRADGVVGGEDERGHGDRGGGVGLREQRAVDHAVEHLEVEVRERVAAGRERLGRLELGERSGRRAAARGELAR